MKKDNTEFKTSELRSLVDEYLSRMNELETKLSFQDDMLDTLNNIVTEQSIEIQKLWDANRLLKSSLEEQKLNQEGIPIDIPPHY